jgi:glycerophosphoryl diester phosphodiesterase
MEKKMHIIAHRGVSAHYLENTILAFEKALELEVYGIELDLHQVEDEFVIFHDFSLDRLRNLRVNLAELSVVQISKIRLKDKYKIPMLGDIFDLVKGNCMLNLELKYVREPERLLMQVKRYIRQFHGDVVLSSFNHPLIRQLQLIDKEQDDTNNIKFAALIGHLPLDMAQYAIDMGVDIAAIDAELVTPEFATHAHAHHIDVWSYTVDFKAGFKKLKEMGVDAVFSNDPALLSSYT